MEKPSIPFAFADAAIRALGSSKKEEDTKE